VKSIQTFTDKTAIGISLLCTIHCLAFPLLIVLLPSLSALPLNDEAFHHWMVFAVVPTSVYALTMGCRQHKQHHLFAIGFLGVSCLILAVLFGETLLNEAGEKILTTAGACIVAYGHYMNFRLCQHKEPCACRTNH
jgi:carbon starvation protein CstA